MAAAVRPYPRPPVAQLVTDQEWLSLSMESLFSPRGYAVLRSFTGNQAVRTIKDIAPDLLMIATDLREMRGLTLCEELRSTELLSPSTPVLLLSAGHVTRDERLDALRAGAWDTCSLPLDAEELFLRTDVWVRAKLAADLAREQGLLDAATGFYNRHGLLRRMVELSAGAVRHGRPLACVAVSQSPATASETRSTASTQTHAFPALARQLHKIGRASDTIGRISGEEFVIVAPDTDELGAQRLAERLMKMLEDRDDAAEPEVRVRFGCYAVPDLREASIAPGEMLVRAAEALRAAQTADQPIRFFSPMTEGRQ